MMKVWGMRLEEREKNINQFDAEWVLEPADWRDYVQLHHLSKVCFKPEDQWPFWDLIGVLTLPGLVQIKAVSDGRMLGFLGGEREPAKHRGWITTLAVLPHYRRQGIARALLEEGEKELNLPRIRLSVRASNLPAVRLYESAGYQMAECWRRYYAGGEDALVFEKRR
ncbi:MAG: GNAT family N-acetyltransferase [Brevefilum sp.]